MFFRSLVYLWTLPTSMVGLVVAGLTLLTGGHVRIRDGVLETWGGTAGWLLSHLIPLPGGALAMTLGHVILGRSTLDLDRCRPHEHVHVRQAERWGPLFIPAYLLVSLVLLARRKNPYRDNPFEREAYRKTCIPPRPES